MATPAPDLLLVDGQQPPQLDDGTWLLAPGQHELRVQARGHQEHRESFAAEAGQTQALTVHLNPISAAVAPPQVAAATLPTSSSRTSHPVQTAGVVTLIGGGASLAASVVTGLLAYGLVGELIDDCPEHTCPPARENTLSAYDTYRTVSTITFYAGLGLSAAGLAMLLLDDDEDAPADVALEFGPTSVRFGGTL